MRTLVTLLAAGLVLASCEQPSPSAELTAAPERVAGPGTGALAQSLDPAGNATFEPVWGAPGCAAVGSRCDSGELLEGRGSLGPELHQPNTVGGACADGTQGTYGSSPSLERLAVSRADGTAFAAGKAVTVEATVIATTTYWDEVLDLYAASDASSPTWIHIATLEPSSSGTQVLSTTYLLPEGGLQVLRGVYRMDDASASACVPGSLHDHDDLVIAVGVETDSTPPAVAITFPAEGATVRNVVNVAVNASDDFGVQRVELYDGSTLISSDAQPPFSPSWATRTVPNGPYTLTARAYDAAGHVSTSVPVNVVVDNDFVPPSLSFLTPAEGAAVSQTVSVSGLVSDDRGVVRVDIEIGPSQCGANACAIQMLQVNSDEPFEQFQVDWNTRGTANGQRFLRAKAYDKGGNASPVVMLNVIVDNDYAPPVTALTAPTSGSLLSGLVSVEASASDDRSVASVSFYVDGHLIQTDTAAPFAISWDTSSVFNGGHTLHTVATDGAGNKTTSTSVTVETNNPGADVSYDPVLKAPRCGSVQASCDSRNLLRGRADTGLERNAPNTLDSCVEGAIYNSTYNESVERIRVIREDGTVLAPGKRVRIEADVWVSQASFDALHLYYTADATQPSWTRLTSFMPLRPPSGTSNQSLVTLSAEYVLPAGNLQAVRAEFGFSEGFGTCSVRSPWVSVTDHDDLVFPVSQEADTVPPQVAITSPANGATVSGQVPVSFLASDDFDVVAVELWEGQTRLMTVNQGQFTFSMGWNSRNGPNGSRTLTVRARDAAGNVGISQPVTVAADNDLTAPVVSLTAPAAGSRFTPGTVELAASASDDRSAIDRVEFYNGSTWLCTDSSAPYTCPWTVGSVSQASNRTLTARAYDAVGNMGTSAAVGVTVVPELTPPSVSLTAPGGGSRLVGTVTLSANATDASGVSKVEFLLDGVLLGTTFSPYDFYWDTRTAASGVHTLSARATDSHGNVATSAEVGVTVDNAGPAVAITSPAQGATVGGVVSLQADALDDAGVTRVEFLVDGVLLASDTTAPFSVDWDSGGTSNGPHTLLARAYDALNNKTSSAQVTVNTNQPGSAVYDPLLRVPVCTTPDSVCDTTSLVKGRSTSEPNPPNTLNGSCPDGTGSLPFQINRLELSSVDGQPFVQGGRVRLEVHVTAYSYSSNKLDLFYAGDATNPTWTYLTTLRPGGEGAQVLSTEYVLPAGRLQAVRAQLKLSSSSTVACGTGTYDERDDLAFAVEVVPMVALTTPSSNAYVKGQVSLAATATADQGVARVEFYVDGTLLGTDTSAPYELSWDTTPVAEGAHTLTAKTYDSGGRSGTSPPVVVNLDNTPPDVALTSPVPGSFLRGTAVLEATASDTGGVARVEFYRGTTLLGSDTSAPYTLSWNTTGVAAGAQTLTVKALDNAGNVRTSAGVEVTVDNTVPATAITAPAQNALVGGTVQVSANASDNLGVVKVELYVDGALLGTDTSAPYAWSWNSSSELDGTHTLTSKAYDAAGNVTASAGVLVTTDKTPPDAALTSPVQGTWLRGTAVLEATASDLRGVAKVEFYDGAALIGTDTSAPYALSWNTVGVGDGARSLTVRAHDSAGNVRTSAGVAVTVDNTAPATAVSAPAQNASVRGTVPVSATASDTYGVERVEFYAGATLLGTVTVAPYVVSWDTTAVANGSVTLTTRAYDNAGNVTQSANHTVTVDHTAPTVAITSPANGATFGFLTFSTTLQASASDNSGVTQVVFYDGASVIGTDTTAPYSVTWNVGSVPNGTHTLTARAYDAAGNVTTSAPISVKVN